MARQKKFKKMQMPKALENAKELIIKKTALIIVSIISVILAWVIVTAFLDRSDYFRVRSIDAKGASEASLTIIKNELLKYYKDKNIFKIDLGYAVKSLEPKYPDAKDIIVKRVLPDKLLVDIRFRKPVALLGNGQYYPVDREGVILVNVGSVKSSNLPIIKGIDMRLAGKPHKKNESKALNSALNLIDEIRKKRFLDKYNIRIIDASDIKSLSFYIGDEGPSVIIGYENFEDRLDTLKDVLLDPRLILDKINYIDVRFKDVAVSSK